MIIGVPKEVKDQEGRVALVPHGVTALCEAGHEVLVQSTAGEGCALPDSDYASAGAQIVNGAAEVWRKADVVVKVKEPQPSEYDFLREGLTLFTYLHLAPLRELTDRLLASKTTGIAYETIVEKDGSLPLLTPMSEVAGRMAAQVGAQYLEAPNGGRGVLLGGVPGVAPANVVIVGGGVVGTNLRRTAAHPCLEHLDGDGIHSSCRPGDWRGAYTGSFRAARGTSLHDRQHAARHGGGGRGHRSGRMF
jgi:alanine dehydrogenase